MNGTVRATSAVVMGDRRMDKGKVISAPVAPSVSSRAAGETTSDHGLVAAVRAGDDHAFERLYRRYHRRIAAYVYGMVHDYAKAEDITQDVFMSALRRMRETDRPIAFKPWIYEIAKNACIDQFRRSRRAEEVSYDAEDGLGASDYRRLASTEASPDAAVDTKLTLDNLRGAFGGLSETHHEILVMRELEGLSYREIGERLGMSRPSVESTLFRARRRLSEEYEELVTGERCRRIQGIIATVEGAEGATLGARDQRRMARHISYCQPCRRQARMAGVDAGVLARRPVREKIAALLPLPAFLRRRFAGGSPGVEHDGAAALAGGSHVSGLAQWGSSLASYVDPTWVKAAATAATVAVAGVGAGVATTHGTGTGVPGLRVSHLVGGPGGGGAAGGPSMPGGSVGAPSAGASGLAGGNGRALAAAGAGDSHVGSTPSAGAKPSTTQDTGTGAVAALPGAGQQPATGVTPPAPPAAPNVDATRARGLKQLLGGATSGSTTAAAGGGGPQVHGAGDPANGGSLNVSSSAGGGSSTGAAAGGAVQGAGEAVGGAVQGAGDTVSGAVPGAGPTAGGALQGAGDAVSGATQGAGDALKGIGGALPAGG
jgi:RNA polymerase sigma factor (sigma-70 family)